MSGKAYEDSNAGTENWNIHQVRRGPEDRKADNLCSALRELGIEPDPLPTPLNLFMNVEVGVGGRLVFAPPKSRAGDSIVLRAEIDLAIALSSCPASTCNGGAPAKPLAFEILHD